MALRESAGVHVEAGERDVDVREHAGLRLGHGCRDGQGHPNDPDMRAARRAHALESAMDALAKRLERLQEKIAELEERFADPTLSDDEFARISALLERLDERQDKVLDRIESLAQQVAGLLARWNEEPPEGWQADRRDDEPASDPATPEGPQ